MTQASNQALKRLTKALDNLQLAQADVREAYKQIALVESGPAPDSVDTNTDRPFEVSSVEETSLESRSTNSSVSESVGELIEGTGFRIGDSVRITNPRPHQEKKGKVIGKTKGKDFFIRVETASRAVILRKSFNLSKLVAEKNDRKRKPNGPARRASRTRDRR